MCAHTLFTGLLIATTIAIKEYLFRFFLAIATLCSSNKTAVRDSVYRKQWGMVQMREERVIDRNNCL